MLSRIPLLILLASCWLTAHGTEIGYAAKAVDLLDRPERQAKALSKLAKRQAVEIVGRDGSWARAKSGTATGWVRLGDLRLTATMLKSPVAPTARANYGKNNTGIRGFSEEELLVGAPNQAEGERLKRLGVSSSEAGRPSREPPTSSSTPRYARETKQTLWASWGQNGFWRPHRTSGNLRAEPVYRSRQDDGKQKAGMEPAFNPTLMLRVRRPPAPAASATDAQRRRDRLRLLLRRI